MYKNLIYVVVLTLTSVLAVTVQAEETKWTWTGFGGGGYFWCAAFDPTDSNTIYMGSDVLGAYKTVDRGVTWKLINKGLQNYGVYSVVVARSNPKVVYVMTQNGMAHSDNGGESWTPLQDTLNDAKQISINRHGSVRAIAVDPTDAKIVYGGSATGELFKSVDAGETWTQIEYANPAPEPAPIGSVTIAEADPNLIFVAHRQAGVFRSADGGKTWTHPDTPSDAACIAVYAKDAKIVYGAFATDGVWQSTDGGMTWTQTESLEPKDMTVRDIAIDPRDPKVVRFISSIGWSGWIGTSRDGGKTWTTERRWTWDELSNPSLVRDLSKEPAVPMSRASNIVISPTEPDVIYVSSNRNNLLSTDGGTTWVQRDNGAEITCFHDARFADGSVFVAAMDTGVYQSDDNGATWTNLVPRTSGRHIDGLSGHHWRVFAQRKPDGKFRVLTTVSPWRAAGQEYPNAFIICEEGGDSLTRGQGLPDYLPKKNVMWSEGAARALAVDPQNPSTMYLGIDGDPEPGKSGGGIFKSTDGGFHWTQLPNQPESRRSFYGLAVDPTDSKKLYWGANAVNSGVWMSDDGGESWTRTNVREWIMNIEVAPSGLVLAGGSNLWKSADRGKTWRKITEFREQSISGIAVDPQDEDRIWCSIVPRGPGSYNSSRGAVWRSVDGGKNWEDISGDLPYRRPLVLRYNPVTRELWAAGVGLFKTKQ